MWSRQILSSMRKIHGRTLSSTKEKIIDLTIDDEGIAVMNWQRRPVNSYNSEFFQAIVSSLDDLEKNERYKGLIMTSAIPKIFSAGLDLRELYKPDPERLIQLARAMQAVFFKLYGSEVTTTVAINGYAAAGSCVVSMMCDYRVMVNDNTTIGLNDTAVGIVPSWWVCEIMKRAMGYRQAELAITTSRMYTADEAMKVQMIDEIAMDKKDAIEKCKKFIRLYDNINKKTQGAAKRQLRQSVINYAEENREEDAQALVRNIMNSHAQEQIGKYVEQLKNKKAK